MAIARMARSTAWRARIRPVFIIIILVDYLILIQCSYRQDVAWLVLPADWCPNSCPKNIPTVPRETLTGAFNFPLAGFLGIGEINLIPEGTVVIPPPIGHLVMVFVKHLPHLWADGCPPLLERQPPPPAMWPDSLELCNVVSHDSIKKDNIIKVVPGPIILTASNIMYLYESMDEFRDESLYKVPIQHQASIYNWCRHLCPCSCLPLSFEAALWCHCCELKMNLHLTH